MILFGVRSPLIDAIADGRATITEIGNRLKAAEDARNEFQQCLADLDDENVVLLHPTIALNYRRQIERLTKQ